MYAISSADPGQRAVQLLSHGGRELVLYRVKAGDSVFLRPSCLIADQRYPAEGITDDEVEAVALGRTLFNNAMDQSPQFRSFVFANFARRLVQVIARMDEVTYGAVDARLSKLLLDGSPRLETTHQSLATELWHRSRSCITPLEDVRGEPLDPPAPWFYRSNRQCRVEGTTEQVKNYLSV